MTHRHRYYSRNFWQACRPGATSEAWSGWINPLSSASELSTAAQGLLSPPALIGFACDAGVVRNYGIAGAAEGPAAIRRAMLRLALHRFPQAPVPDLGDVLCLNPEPEEAQRNLGALVAECRSRGYQPLVFGGGHETAWGHFQGLIPEISRKSRLAIINFDAHFDLRPSEHEKKESSSGTPFRQILEHCRKAGIKADYFCFGIQESANAASLFRYFSEHGKLMITAAQIHEGGSQLLSTAISKIIKSYDCIYLSICLDVFSSGCAPGVSAVQPEGIFPHHIRPAVEALLQSGRVLSSDIVELNPAKDSHQMTARLAASLAHLILLNSHQRRDGKVSPEKAR
ncbi:MAG: formimidoylglutamase [Deltaproteobacteria bacterium]|nr:formimidoylglutamase [Deltaproteobacteria bacterium]